MGWIEKIFNGPGRNSKYHYHEYSDDDEDSHYHTKSFGGDIDIDHAIALSLFEEENRKGKSIEIKHNNNSDEDEMVARALHESLNTESPPHHKIGQSFQQRFPFFPPSEIFRICEGCKYGIGQGHFRNFMGCFWHSECFRCRSCGQPIFTDNEAIMHRDQLFHKSCCKDQYGVTCEVCKNYIPKDWYGRVQYRVHPFWNEKFCPSHEKDGTFRCCSCQRMEPRDVNYVTLDDGRKLCLECLNSAIMDTNECQGLYIEIREFYEGLNMKVSQQIPLLLVEREGLNEAIRGEKTAYHNLPETRGMTIAEVRIIPSVMRRPIFGAGNRIRNLITYPYQLERHSEITAIIVLYGLPRLLTGSILAHEMMHAWLRLNGFGTLKPEVEEGICQVLSHMWLESEIMSGSSRSSSSSSSSSSSNGSSKKGKRSEFETKLGECFKFQIENDVSHEYGEGFRMGSRAVEKFGLRRTLEHIRHTGSFPR